MKVSISLSSIRTGSSDQSQEWLAPSKCQVTREEKFNWGSTDSEIISYKSRNWNEVLDSEILAALIQENNSTVTSSLGG